VQRGLGRHRALEHERGRKAPILLFRLALFKIAELQILEWNLKISKNKSCIGAIDLQLSQRACFDQRIRGKNTLNFQEISAPVYCAQKLQLKFKRLCTPNWNVHQL
jgi:hypothetical protein